MTKTQFRILVVLSLFFGVLAVVSDLVISNPILYQVTVYAESLEAEWSADTKTYIGISIGVLLIIYLIYTFIGLLFFWNNARLFYLAGFIVSIPFYFYFYFYFLGIVVVSPIGGLLYDSSNILSGMILALIYFSPVKQYFTERSNKEA